MTNLVHELEQFAKSEPEIVFEWSDRETNAKGWLVINSLFGGAAGGGTRMRPGLSRDEVVALAKTMEIKFTVCGPAIGGAKSGIDFDPNDPRKSEVLQRWFKAVTPILKSYYGTGGDLNIDEIREVIPYLEANGVVHPQAGIIHGHFLPDEAQKIDKIGQLRRCVTLPVRGEAYTPKPKKFTVADLITGYGTVEAVKQYYKLWGGDITNKRAIVQGWGNVGAAAAFYLAKSGVRVIAVTDKAGGIIKENGFSFDEISTLFSNKEGTVLKCFGKRSHEDMADSFWNSGAEIFIPAAASRLITGEHIEKLLKGGLEVVSCGANVPFKEQEIFFGPITQLTDSKTSLIADFVANCGMARVFSYLMQDGSDLSEEAIFEDTSKVIKEALEEIYNYDSGKSNLTSHAFKIALMKIRSRSSRL